MIALLALLAVHTGYVGPARGSVTVPEAEQVIADSEEACAEIGRHDERWEPVPYLRQFAEARRYTYEQQGLLTGLCTLYMRGWTAALVDHQRRRERRQGQ